MTDTQYCNKKEYKPIFVLKKTTFYIAVLCVFFIIRQGVLLTIYGEESPLAKRAAFCQKRKIESKGNSSGGRKLILFWNKFDVFYYYGFRRDEFDFLGICGSDRCQTTTNKTKFPDSDAVIISAKNLKSWRGFPKDPRIKRSELVGIPRHAQPDQVFVFFHIEAPARYRNLPWQRYNEAFNLTYTYITHPDTDIRVDHGRIIPRPLDQPYVVPSESAIAAKTRLVAWAVSNCRPASLRRQYVKQLKKHITVDVYGQCGTIKLGCSYREEGCFDFLAREYKFYLAFENSYCKEYVTEKMYRTLTLDVIPVVYGGADYRSMFPNHSYINVEDFKSPKHLADYLLKLANDTDEYLSYFRWKKTLMADTVHNAAHNLGLCKLCDILHDPDYEYKSPCFNYGKYYNPRTYCASLARQRKLIGL